MQWDPALQDLDLLDFYKTLIDIRKSSPALTEGSMQTLYLGQDQWIYSRTHAKEKIIVSLSRSDNSQNKPIEIPLSNTDLIGDEDFSEVFSQTTLSFKDQTLIIPPHAKGAKIYRWVAK